jgi:hypothetical protein
MIDCFSFLGGLGFACRRMHLSCHRGCDWNRNTFQKRGEAAKAVSLTFCKSCKALRRRNDRWFFVEIPATGENPEENLTVRRMVGASVIPPEIK